MKILLIEDDAEMAADIARTLRDSGHEVDVCDTGTQGASWARTGGHAVLVVDRMLPELDGLSLVRGLRAEGMRTPILFLTTMSGIDDRVAGLEAGGDDYLVKPYAFSELNARVNALARRPPLSEQISVLKVADLEMNLLRRTVTRGGDEIDLQPREFQLLEYLLANYSSNGHETSRLDRVS